MRGSKSLVFGWATLLGLLACRPASPVEDDARGADGGVNGLEDKAASVCATAAEGQTVTLSCSGGTIDAITFASYGTPNGSCASGFSTGTCNASTSLEKVRASCTGKQSCTVAASNGVFDDPCGGTSKRLAVTYTCNAPSSGSCVKANENASASLSCPSGQVVNNISFASYGTPTGTCPNLAQGSCHAASSQSKVQSLCLNKQSCSVGANNGLFDDPCSGTSKQLAIKYTCSGGDMCPSDPNKTDLGQCGCGVAEGTCSGGGTQCVSANENASASLSCPSGQYIKTISFASYGTPGGSCNSGYSVGGCHDANSAKIVESACLNKQSCTVAADNGTFTDSCAGTSKKLTVQYACSGGGGTGSTVLDPATLAYYGTVTPSYLEAPPTGYSTFTPNLYFQGGLDGINHASTSAPGAGKFVFNRIYRASKNGLGINEQFGIFHWWLRSYGNNSIEAGIWDNPFQSGPHYYPTLSINAIGDAYYRCNDIQFGGGFGGYMGDRWLTEIQISNRVLTVPGVNIGFDKEQTPYESDNGIWLGWGWTYLNLAHPSGYKFWMTFIESYDYQGPVNGYMPEHFNWINPASVADGSYARRKANNQPFGTFATLGSASDSGIANEEYSQGLRVSDGLYYVPVERMPSYKDREYVVSNIQNVDQSTMEAYSEALRNGTSFSSVIRTNFLPFTSTYSSTHSQLKVSETVNGAQYTTIIRPPYNIGFDKYNGFVQWPSSGALTQQARGSMNGYLYYRRSSQHWPVEDGASDAYKNNPNLYIGNLVAPPDNVNRVPKIETKYQSYNERDTSNPEFANWNVAGKTRYQVQLQNGATATYVWFKFIEQPAVLTAKQNWPAIYTNAYLAKLQTYIENLHRKVAQTSRKGPTDPAFINYRNPNDANHFEPHLVKLDPGQVVVPPAGFEVGYVPMVISVTYPAPYADPPAGVASAPDSECSNAKWTRSYFPNIP